MRLSNKRFLFISDNKLRRKRKVRLMGMLRYVAFVFILFLMVFGVGTFLYVSEDLEDKAKRQEFLSKIRTLNIPQDLKQVYEFLAQTDIFETRTLVYNFIIVKIESNFKQRAINYNKSSGTKDIGYSQINENTYRNYKNDFIRFVVEKIYDVDFSKFLDILFSIDNLFDSYVNIIFSCYYIEYVVYPKIREKGEEVTIEKVLSVYNSNKLYPKNPITVRYITNAITFIRKEGNFLIEFVD